MAQYKITLRYETALTDTAVEEFFATMTGVDKKDIEVVEVGDNE